MCHFGSEVWNFYVKKHNFQGIETFRYPLNKLTCKDIAWVKTCPQSLHKTCLRGDSELGNL